MKKIALSLSVACALASAAASANPGAPTLDPALAQQLQSLAAEAANAALAAGSPPVRVEVELGQLDARLQLAPCQQIQPYLPAGTRPLGRSRIGLRCLQGPTKWNVYLPITVKLFGQALVATCSLPTGSVIEARHLMLAEVDLAASPEPAYTTLAAPLGRTLARPLAAGDTLRRGDLKLRQYFQAGDLVRIVAVGNGYAVSAEGQALNNGLEGQPVRVRTESGRILSGLPAGERRVEIPL
ncbi:flagellar basal body P-ring formation protein FlgA [Aquincola sp. S2]|uniref:Flagella basal body P-ring formation protein FlgA n=1 Tax=Pseudaquabacterium terrae TaxID=2732868 RepID=A0ABX2ENV4_9BURK|nr:flagellar basal body P-ring formation chaperone FlgA [Aquabacterium terrae]NRF70326.1 flagellar basal body P-ring formation protein FlgA [Aquabacterium terrae]